MTSPAKCGTLHTLPSNLPRRLHSLARVHHACMAAMDSNIDPESEALIRQLHRELNGLTRSTRGGDRGASRPSTSALRRPGLKDTQRNSSEPGRRKAAQHSASSGNEASTSGSEERPAKKHRQQQHKQGEARTQTPAGVQHAALQGNDTLTVHVFPLQSMLGTHARTRSGTMPRPAQGQRSGENYRTGLPESPR